MRFVWLGIVVAGLLVAHPPSALGADHGKDEAAIRQLENAQQESWNRHDIKAYAALFAEDGDVVNVFGWRWRSRDELQAKLTRAHASVFAKSALNVGAIDIQFLSPDIAVAHVEWQLIGTLKPDGTMAKVPDTGIQMQVLKKQGGKWLIAAFQNTGTQPEQDFPSPSPGL